MTAKLADAIGLWRAGRVAEAERTCAILLAGATDPGAARALLADIYNSRGQFRLAVEQLQRIAELQPQDAAVQRRLGDAQFAAEEFDAAVNSYRRAISLDPVHPRAHNNLGRALVQLAQIPSAIESYRRATELDPNYAIAHNNLGMALALDECLEEALASYERAIALVPQFAEAIGNRANALLRLNRAEEALTQFERALELNPGNATMLCNCGNALLQLRRTGPALNCCERALRLIPDFPLGLLCRGNVLRDRRDFDGALVNYERAVALQPDYIDALTNKAGILIDTERFDDAITCCDRILELRPDSVHTLYLRALALNYLGGPRYADAVATLARLWELAPSQPYSLGLLVHTSAMIFDWSHSARAGDAVRAAREGLPLITPLALMAITDDAALQMQCARSAVTATHPPIAPPIWRGERWRNSKLRIAYVSGDLRDHALAYLMVGVFEQHDRENFEILGISLREPTNNPFGARVLSSLDLFMDVHKQSDQQVAQLLYDMKVDIAVDLMGLTRANRLNIFAHRPAPIQISYLGYPGTSGASYIDYLLADEFVIPPDSRRWYSESVVYLPDCFQANDNRRAIAERIPERSDVGLPPLAFVFCSFNSCYKIAPELFDIWCRLLRLRPGSVLWMLAESHVAQENLRREALSRGVDPKRIVFAERLPYEHHLARLRLADLFLDSFPFNAGATASDALWAGVPVLTCAGQAFSARMAASLLQTIGLPELITTELDAYERLALRLSAASQWLEELRARLATNRATRPLFDTERFCRHLEAAYTLMHERHLRGEPPDHLSVAPRQTARHGETFA